MKQIEIKKYLKFLGMDTTEKMSFKNCEICGNKNTKLIIKQSPDILASSPKLHLARKNEDEHFSPAAVT